MKNRSLFTLFPIGFLLYFLAGGQNEKHHTATAPPVNTDTEYCAHDLVTQNWLSQNPAHEAQLNDFEKNLRKHILDLQNGSVQRMPVLYTLPVVVHIVHNGGAENITDAQAIQGVEDLNAAYANTGYYNQGTGLDMEIQFCLAKRDPDGNATTGITRDQSPLTSMNMGTDDLALKDLNRWDPLQYINIWLVGEIQGGVAGYAYFPTSHGEPEDGIVMEAQYFGSAPDQSIVQAHEMGHYLGLYHTFQGGCTNNDCTMDGDRVCDTPPDQSTAWVPCNSNSNTCDTDANSGFPTDQPDMFWNYMDYSDFTCYSAFTQGQKDRMVFTIENVRQSLLDSEGCLDPCTSDITATFSASASAIEAGQTVSFFNGSLNATDFDWRANGTSFSNASSPSFQFTEVGNFEVILYATNADPNCFDTDTLTISVTCPTVAGFNVPNLFPPLGQTLNFTNASSGATGYEWLINGVSQSTATDFSYTFDISGTYTVCLDAVGDFCDDSECATLFVLGDSADCQSTFIKTFGLPNSTEEGFVVTESDNGGFFMAGRSGDQTLLVKIDPTGTVAWTRQFDLSPQNDHIRDMKLDSDGMLIGCGQGQNAANEGASFIFRYDHLADDFLWVKNMNQPDLSRQNTILEKAPGDNFYLLGQFAAQPGTQGCDGSLIEVDRATGDVVFMKSYHLGSCETFQKAVIADGDIFTTGRYNFAGGGTNKMRGGMSRLDFSGNETWSRLYLVPVNPDNARIYPNGLIEDNGSLVCMSGGDNDGSSATVLDFHLYATDLAGQIQWAKNMNIVGGDAEHARHLANLPDGYLMMGEFTSNTLGQQIFLVKTDKQGETLWSKQYGGTGDDDAFSLLVRNGFIHFLGRSGTGANSEFFLARLNLDGETLDPCDQIMELDITSADFPNPYDGLHPLTVSNENYPLTNFSSSANEVTVEENPICDSPCVEICDNGIDDDDDGYVDCYDSDCPCNTDECSVTATAQNFATQLDWQSTVNAVSVDGTPIVANLDPQVDSVAEIVVIVSTASAPNNLSPHLLIFKGDGSNAANPKVLPIQGGYDIYSAVNPAIGDVDRDGVPEVVMVSGDRRVRVYTGYNANATPPMTEWMVSPDLADDRNRKPYLADFNSDGIAEVYVGDDIYQFDFSQNPPTLEKELSGGSSVGMNFYAFYQEENCSPVAVDILQPQHCNGDPDCNGLELVAGNVIYSVDLETNDGDGFEIKIQRDLNQMQNQHTYLDGYTSVADVNLDGILDVVVSGGRDNQNGVYVWNRGGAGVIGWFPHLPPLQNPNRSGALPCIANVFDDTEAGAAVDFPEIIVTSQGYLNCYSLNADALGQPDGAWWILSTTDLSGATGATVFDFNADGIEEIIYRDEDNLRIMYGGAAPFPAGADAERNWETFICGSGTFEEHPVVADVDNDGQAEIAVTGYTFAGTNTPPADYRGRLRIFGADLLNGDPWMSARPIWNQYNYFVVNINDDLTLPVEQQLHQLELPGLGSGYRPLNKFVAQIPLLDNDFQPYLPVPDATVSTGAASCNGDSISVELTVCNVGSALLPAATPIAFYLADPTVSATPLHHVTTLGMAILPDSCFSLSANLPTANGTIYVVVNDDGSVPTPYDFGDDFPVTNIPECNYLNNPANFNFSYTPPLPPDLGPDQFFCNNGVADLDAGPGWQTYEWQDGFPEQVYTAWLEGTYWVTVTDSCGTVFSDTVVIEMDTSLQFDLGPDTTICPGESLVFDVPGFDQYEWLPNATLSCADCSPVTASPTDSTTYALVGRDVNGCLSVDSITVYLGGESEIFDTVAICAGDSVLIFGNYETQPGDYVDTLPNPAGCDTIFTFTLEILPLIEAVETVEICAGDSALIFGTWVNAPGNYVDTLFSQDDCDTALTVSLTVWQPLGDSLYFLTENACTGQPDGSVTPVIIGAVGEVDFVWSDGSTGDVLENVPLGFYSVTMTDVNGCVVVDSAAVGETMVGSMTTVVQGATCFGEADGSLTITDFEPGTSFSFDGQFFTDDTLFLNLPAGPYTLFVQSLNGCLTEQEINISEPPALTISLPPDVTIELGDSVHLIAQVSTLGPLDYVWSPTDWLSCDNCPAPWAGPFENTVYTLTVANPDGCTDEDDIAITVLRPLNVYVPNGFSPNGDGINDAFTVFAGRGVGSIRRLLIFDRWGEQVFEGENFPPNDPAYGWDGTFREEAMNPAVFAWFAEVEFIDGRVELLEGDVTLVR